MTNRNLINANFADLATTDVNGNITGLTVGNISSTNGYFWANGAAYSSGSGTTYSNANVASYLSSNTDPTITALWANDTFQQGEITAANAAIVVVQNNLTAYETYGNATYATQSGLNAANTAISTNASNLTSFETYANATYATQTSLSGYATQSGLNAANTAIATNASNLTSFEGYANLTYQPSATLNSAIASYLPTYQGYIGGNITVGGNLTVQGNVVTNGYDEVITGLLVANSTTPATSTTTGALQSYGGAGIQGALYAGSVQTNTYNFANGTSIFTGINSAINQVQTNLTAYETYGNATYATQSALSAYETYGNATYATQAALTAANTAASTALSGFETYANATYATQSALSAYETYGNATYSTIANAATLQSEINSTNANVTAANAAIASLTPAIGNVNIYETVSNNTLTSIVLVDNSQTGIQQPLINSTTPGTTWTTQSWPSNTYGIANSGNNIIITTTSGISVSTNGGTSWTSTFTSNPGSSISQPFVDSNGNVYVGAENSSTVSAIWKSTNGGNTWVNVHTVSGTPPASFASLTTSSGSEIVALLSGEANLIVGTNGGNTWADSNPASLTTTPYSAFQVTGLISLMGCLDGIYRSTDGAGTWTKVQSTTQEVWAFTNTGTSIIAAGYATSGNGSIWRSTDNGVTWTATYTAPSVGNGDFRSIISVGSVILAGANGNPGIIRSTDDGRTWTTVNSSVSEVYNMAAFSGTVYAASYGTPSVVSSSTTSTGLLYDAPTNTLLANISTIGNVVSNYTVANSAIVTNGVFWANGTAYGGGSSSYGNTQVAQYLASGTDATISNLQTEITANATLITGLQTQVTANAATLSSFQTYANSTYATQTALSGFETYANSTYATQTALTNFETYANATFGSSNYGNSNVAAYLPTYTGYIGNGTGSITIDAGAAVIHGTSNIGLVAPTITVTGAISATGYAGAFGNVSSQNGFFWSNGTAYSGTYGNTQVAAYLAVGSDPTITAIQSGATAANTAISNLQTEVTANAALITGLQTQMTSNAALITGLQTQMTSNAALITNLQTEVTANASTLSTLQANVGSFYTYANATYATIASAYSNSNVATYLVTNTGNIHAGNITTTGTETVGNLITTNGIFWSNGTAYSTGGGSSGVSQIVAGTNVTISPSGGTGVVTINASGGGGGGLSWQSVQTANVTAVAGDAYPINTTGGNIWVTMPSSPSAGSIVNLTDYAGTWATNGVEVLGNGSNIQTYGNVVLNTNRESVAFVYIDSTQGWIPYSGFNTSTPGPYVPPSGPYTASYLVVAGGGGGGAGQVSSTSGGGGGAGGMISGTKTLTLGTTYSFTVGGGGAGHSAPGCSPTSGTTGASGSSSSALCNTSVGGGGGGGYSTVGANGGSGGGTGTRNTTSSSSGTSGQGYGGGVGGNCRTSGGGGGAGAAGGAGMEGVAGGAGGAGLQSSITGTATYYAGGGGGGSSYSSVGGTGGSGGGGNGYGDLNSGGGNGYPGTANTGGGGGGGDTRDSGALGAGGSGGSGVIIISVPTVNYSGTTTGGPTVTTSGSNTILTFTSSGSYTA